MEVHRPFSLISTVARGGLNPSAEDSLSMAKCTQDQRYTPSYTEIYEKMPKLGNKVKRDTRSILRICQIAS